MKTIEFHIIQTYNASNPNRDANGDPKTVTVGGVKRARISSQSLKRAMRDKFSENANVGLFSVGKRTKMRVQLEKRLVGMNDENGKPINASEASVLANLAWNLYSGKDANLKKSDEVEVDEDSGESEAKNDDNAMMFVDQNSVENVVKWVASNSSRLKNTKKPKNTKGKGKEKSHPDKLVEIPKEDSKDFQKMQKEFLTMLLEFEAIDIALFGRMTASQRQGTVEGSCLVAHAFSTHRLVAEFDFFTAVDDFAGIEDDKVGMLDSKGFNASTMYRNLVVDVVQLEKNLDADHDKTETAIRAFVKAMVDSYPKALRNSHGEPPRPQAIIALIRDSNRTANLGDAFLRPIQSEGARNVAEISVEQLAKCYESTTRAYPDYRADEAMMVSKSPEIKFPGADEVDVNVMIERIVAAYRSRREKSAA